MKAILAVFGLVLFVFLAECTPAKELAENMLRKRIQEKIAERGTKRGEDQDGQAEEVTKRLRKPDWPYGWMEFAALYAKCERGGYLTNMFKNQIQGAIESVHVKAENSVLARACPHVLEAGESLMEANEEGRKAAEPFLEEGLPVMQCANLIADKEAVGLIIILAGGNTEDSEFLKDSNDLFDICDEVYGEHELLKEELKAAKSAKEAVHKKITK